MTTLIQNSPLGALLRAVKLIGGQTALARALDISQGQVWSWINRDKRASALYTVDIEELTQGAVTRYELRPDIFRIPPPPAQTRKARKRLATVAG
jgi:DNA-binding transcriptional regulator YdaS (Cro superfamily)